LHRKTADFSYILIFSQSYIFLEVDSQDWELPKKFVVAPPPLIWLKATLVFCFGPKWTFVQLEQSLTLKLVSTPTTHHHHHHHHPTPPTTTNF
jgi:hypothetical protein